MPTSELPEIPTRPRRQAPPAPPVAASNGHAAATTTRYEIRLPSGQLVAIHERLETPAGKRMHWRAPDGAIGLGGVPLPELPLYGSERLAGWDPARPVLLTEGEKAAQALIDAGWPALGTVTGAASMPGPDALEALRGRHVVLWPDNDQVGEEHMTRVADRLRGVARSTRTLSWPEAPEHGDAADYLASAMVDVTIEELIAESRALGLEAIRLRLGARTLDEMSMEAPPPMLVGRLDPLGHTILYGTGGTGKGVIAAYWLLQLASEGHRVLILDYENHPDEWARRVFGLGGADLLPNILHVAPLTAAWQGKRGPLWDQVEDVRALAAEWGATYMLIDSIAVACSGSDPLKSEAATQYTAALEYIGLPALSLAHVTKIDDLRYPFGTVMWHNLSRITWSAKRSGESIIVTHRKHNNYEQRPATQVTVTWTDGLPRDVWERVHAEVLATRISTALRNGPLSASEIEQKLNVEVDVDEDGDPVKVDSIRKSLARGAKAKPPKFAKHGGDRWKNA